MQFLQWFLYLITSYSFRLVPTSKDFRGSGSHRQLFCPYWGPPAWHSHWVNEQGKPASQKPLTAKKQSIKHQLYATHVGAVGWEPHRSSTTTCAGKVDHKLPVNQSKGHTYTNPWPSHYACAQPYHAGGQPWSVVSPILGLNSMAWPSVSDRGNLCTKTLYCRGKSFKCQFHTTHVGAVGWEPHSSSTTTCAGKADHGFGVCVPLALICLLKIVN